MLEPARTRPRTLPPLPPGEEDEFQAELTKAIDFAEARLKKAPKDIDARQDVGAAYALQASYVTSVKASTTAAYGPAKKAFEACK